MGQTKVYVVWLAQPFTNGLLGAVVGKGSGKPTHLLCGFLSKASYKVILRAVKLKF